MLRSARASAWRKAAAAASRRGAAGRSQPSRAAGGGGGGKGGALSDFVNAMLKRRGGGGGEGDATASPAAPRSSPEAEEEIAEMLQRSRLLDADGAAARPFAASGDGGDGGDSAEMEAALAEANRVVASSVRGARTESAEDAARSVASYEPLPSTPLRTERVRDPDAPPIPRVAKALRRVVTQPGTHPMHDFDDKTTLHFPQYFSKVYQPEDVAWDAIPPFTTSSRDERLMRNAERESCRVAASTSSTTSLLAHMYFVYLRFRHINVNLFSPAFSAMPRSYTRATKSPSQTVLRRRGEHLWGMDSSPRYAETSNEILMQLGKTMEYGAVMEPDEFRREMLLASKDRSKRDRSGEEHFRFIRMGSMMMRSQLDAAKDLAGKYVFDLKTRATNPIRMSVGNYRRVIDYRLTKAHGVFGSFEREWFDMARSAFIKYVLQCRIGQMQGVMVTFHNTAEVFGFEHIPLSHMEQILFGGAPLADAAYNSCTRVLDRVLCEVTDRFADDHVLKVTAHANRMSNKMLLFVERVDKETRESAKEREALLAWLERRARAEKGGLDAPPAPSRADLAIDSAEVIARDAAEKVSKIGAWRRDRDDAGGAGKQAFPLHHFCLQNHVLRLDWMSEAELRRRLAGRGLPSDGPRAQLVARLEDAEKAAVRGLAKGASELVPHPSFYRGLVESGRLVCYELDMKHYVGGADSGQVLRRQLSPSDIGSVDTRYSFRDVTKEWDPVDLAAQYRRFVADMNSEGGGVSIPVPREGERQPISTPARHLTHPAGKFYRKLNRKLAGSRSGKAGRIGGGGGGGGRKRKRTAPAAKQ